MTITITFIRLRHFWQFFSLSIHGFKIAQQARKQQGFIDMKNTGWGKLHYTCSAWENVESMKHFMRQGSHLQAMKVSARLATEIRTYTFEDKQLPSWDKAKELLLKNGKILPYS